MSRTRYTLAFDHANMVPAPAGTVAVKTIFKSEDGILQCYGTTVPTDDASGYAKGCLFYHTDGDINDKLYVNDGDADDCDFNTVGGEGAIRHGVHEITNGEVLTMYEDNSNKGHLLLIAPGTGKIIEPISVLVKHNVSTAFVHYAGVQIVIGTNAVGSIQRTLLEATSDWTARSTWGADYGVSTNLENQALYIQAATLNPTTGGGTLSVRFAYRILDFN